MLSEKVKIIMFAKLIARRIKNPSIKCSVIVKAINTAAKSDVKRGRIGAVLFTSNGRIVASASNRAFFGLKDRFTIHAERLLLARAFRLKALDRLGVSNLNILVVRLRSVDNKLSNAKPCTECQFYLKEAGLKVFYSDEEGNIQKLDFNT
jgi:cytidine deaminase